MDTPTTKYFPLLLASELTGPFGCTLCLSETAEPFTKTHAGVLCRHCVARVATDHGYAPPEDITKLEQTIERQKAQIRELKNYKNQVGEIEISRRLAVAIADASAAAAELIEATPGLVKPVAEGMSGAWTTTTVV